MSVKLAGNSTDPTARVTTTRPSSSGWRRPSSASRRNSLTSSRNSTPWWARHASPGRRNPDPPPRSPAAEMVWCGARNGRSRTSRPSVSRPGHRVQPGHLERLRPRERGQDRREAAREHRLAGPRRADEEQRCDRPPPRPPGRVGAMPCPRTSAKSSSAAPSTRSSWVRSDGTPRGAMSPEGTPLPRASDGAPITSSPSTREASAAFAAGRRRRQARPPRRRSRRPGSPGSARARPSGTARRRTRRTRDGLPGT